MIDTAITQIARSLNQSLRRGFGAGEDLVTVSSLLDQDGGLAAQAVGKLSVFVVNIERDTLPVAIARTSPGARVGLAPPPVCLNLMVMFAAQFSGANYPEALKLISGPIAFFQSRPLFDHHNTPDLDPRIDRLALDIENLAFGDLGNVWGMLGGKYVPSVLYKMRMVSIDGGQVSAEVARVVQQDVGVGSQAS
jgi:hypothetical protein